MTTTERANAIRSAIKLGQKERLYGVVDGAQDLDLAYEAKCLYGQNIVSLFQGEMAAATSTVAPYVVPIDPAGGYLNNWAQRWGRNAGILLASAADSERLCSHLREVFVVTNEQGQEHFFRFYDPRVLRVYLPTCTPEEVRDFFGPITTMLSESRMPDSVLRFAVDFNGISTSTLDLSNMEATP